MAYKPWGVQKNLLTTLLFQKSVNCTFKSLIEVNVLGGVLTFGTGWCVYLHSR